MTLVNKAAAFAAKVHEGQFRKGEPPRSYITHPQEVAALLKRAGVEDPVTLAAAWLHDVMEDCDVPYETLEAHFGAEVAGLVRELTDDPSLGKNAAKEAQLQKARTPEHAGGYSTRARLVKLADKLANLTDIYKHPPGWRRESVRGYADSSLSIANWCVKCRTKTVEYGDDDAIFDILLYRIHAIHKVIVLETEW